MFWKAVSTFVESKADVSMKLKLFLSEKDQGDYNTHIQLLR